ncbi:MAG: thiamine pyrophosphate-dependent dehydrogenase E1 component subunit alpha [Verrucomicrobiae bacterium]|nr:thiamine pyrophosphate-dependent dehydrogenase E1 component subunit alpha [Verrucomicrobiae bacterium]
MFEAEEAINASEHRLGDVSEKARKAFWYMLLARAYEEKMALLYRAGKISGGVFLSRGQEALSAAIGVCLKKGDIFAPLIRDSAGRLAFGTPLLDPIRTYLGSVLGPMRGRDGNVHFGRPRDGILAMISHLGAMVSAVNGCLMAKRFKGETGFVGVASVGDGATSTGSFHEAVNQAAVERLPLVIVVANNHYAYSTPNNRQFACKNLVDRAIGYGIAGHTVDGTDLAECLKIIGNAVELARNGNGPQMVVAELLRLSGHGEHDDASYMDEELKKSQLGRDCISVAESILLKNKWSTEEEIANWKQTTTRTIETAVAQVMNEPHPNPDKEDWTAISTKYLVDSFLQNEHHLS